MTPHGPLPTHARRLHDLDEARRHASAGARLEATRAAALRLRERLRALPTVRSVRTFELVTFPYPTRYAFGGAASSWSPWVFMTNRMQLVTFGTDEGIKRLLVNPSDFVADSQTPYFQRVRRRIGRLGGRIADRMLARRPDVRAHLQTAGIAPEQIDFVTFDHLHTQDCRRLLGEWLPRAKLLARRTELEVLAGLHPLQREWYQPQGLDGIPAERIVPFEGDVLLGEGVALVSTPGHTWGNHTIVLHTDRGLWTISENGVAADSYRPEHSQIPGLSEHARDYGVEAILNSNTLEGSLDQYTSMVLEATLADPVPDAPEFVQHYPSSELASTPLLPGVAPTYSFGAITWGPEPATVSG